MSVQSRAAQARLRSLGPERRDAVRWSVPAPVALVSALARAGWPGSPDMAWTMWLTVAVLLAVGGLAAGGAGLAAVAVGLAACAPVVVLAAAGDRSARVVDQALPGALEAIARGLRAGASLRQAIAEAALGAPEPLQTELSSVALAAERGSGLVEALEGWGVGRDRPAVRLTVAALALVAETGGAPAQTLDAVASTLRERGALEREVRALSTQARASAAVVAAAPLAFAALAAAADPRTAGFLLGTPVGLTCLTAGVALDGAGALWMQRITRSLR